MNSELAIRNGTVLTADGVAEIDLFVKDGRIASIGGDHDSHTTIDANGAWVGPGLVDLHCHLREPGEEWKEDIASGSAAAAAGGFTALVAMPNTKPAIDSGHLACFITERGRQVGLCQIATAGAITMARDGKALSHLDELWDAGVRIFTDDGASVADAGLLRLAMEYLAERGAVVAQHAEDQGLSLGGQMHEGAISSLLGLRGIPALAEELVVARDLALARLTGVRYHVQHISSRGTLDLISDARAQGLPVTSEVTPHHLAFDDERVMALDPAFKMYPPLRAASDREALVAGLSDGSIDVVATDHAPHAPFETEVTFAEAPRGVIGLESAASAVMTACSLPIETFFARMSISPAQIAQLENQGRRVATGILANLVVFDPERTWTPDRFRSRSENSPFRGEALRGMVLATIYEGRVTHSLVKS
ncbi:MAG: dihydroorotase [Acidimicrobiia bacterium]